MKHTPGPWRIYKQDDSEHPGIETENLSIVIYGIRDEDDGGIRGGSIEQEMANARLIAAAPELLEALQDMVLCARTGVKPHECMKFAEKVIAKAEGRSA